MKITTDPEKRKLIEELVTAKYITFTEAILLLKENGTEDAKNFKSSGSRSRYIDPFLDKLKKIIDDL